MDVESPYLIADDTMLSNKEARAYVAWHSHGNAESVADDLDVSESTAWSYKYRINKKLERAVQTVSPGNTVQSVDDPDTVLENTFFNRNVRGNDRGASRDHALAMVEAHMRYNGGESIQSIAAGMGHPEEDVDCLLGEAEAISRRAETTLNKLQKLS